MSEFPQLRRDPIVERWVLVAPERAQRPGAYRPTSKLPEPSERCPFCEGNEDRTPPEVQAVRESITPPDSKGWQVRVIPNRFPSVRDAVEGPTIAGELFDHQPGVGAHELVIECPQHQTSLFALSPQHITDVFSIYCDRIAVRRAEGRFAYTQLFKNHGMAAGASVPHAHAQIISLPLVPPLVRAELNSFQAHHERTGRCLFCDFIEREIRDGARVARLTDTILAVTAYAGRFPYETWLLPRKHARHFDHLSDKELSDLATTFRWLVGRTEELADHPAYNLVLHNAPFHEGADFHWHFEFLPRLTGVAGFEWGAGIFVNPMPPEEAAGRLRS